MDYDEKLLKKLESLIIKVIDENGEEITFDNVKIELEISKYSSSHSPSPVLIINNEKRFFKNRSIKITYRCLCGNENTILLKRFLIKKTLKCKNCRETEEKRKWHSEVLKKIHKKEKYIPKTTKNKRNYDFNAESDSFKKNYFLNNLTIEEFENIKKYIYSINDIEVFNKEYSLLPFENGVNHKKYRQMILIDGKIIPFKNIKLKCPLCGKIFSISRMIKERVIKHNFDCKGCCLNNKTFATHKIKDNLTFQGKQELLFIDKCFENNIDIINGPEIDYIYDNKKHIYRIDFYLPKLKMLIEIKDNHIWHRKQIENGKWDCKYNAAVNYAYLNGMTYHLLFKKDFDTFFASLKEIV